MFCVELKQPEELFFNSSLSKVLKLLELHAEFNNPENHSKKPIAVDSMKSIPGW